MTPIFWVIFMTIFDPLFWGYQKWSKNGPKTQNLVIFCQKWQKIDFFLIFPTPIFAIFAFPHPPLPKIFGGGQILTPKKWPFLGHFLGQNHLEISRISDPPKKWSKMAIFGPFFGVRRTPKNGDPKKWSFLAIFCQNFWQKGGMKNREKRV